MAEQQVFATKGNLILYKKALKLAALGYELQIGRASCRERV